MAFARADTSMTMVSQAWSTSEMTSGLEKLLLGDNSALPDDPVQLED